MKYRWLCAFSLYVFVVLSETVTAQWSLTAAARLDGRDGMSCVAGAENADWVVRGYASLDHKGRPGLSAAARGPVLAFGAVSPSGLLARMLSSDIAAPRVRPAEHSIPDIRSSLPQDPPIWVVICPIPDQLAVFGFAGPHGSGGGVTADVAPTDTVRVEAAVLRSFLCPKNDEGWVTPRIRATGVPNLHAGIRATSVFPAAEDGVSWVFDALAVVSTSPIAHPSGMISAAAAFESPVFSSEAGIRLSGVQYFDAMDGAARDLLHTTVGAAVRPPVGCADLKLEGEHDLRLRHVGAYHSGYRASIETLSGSASLEMPPIAFTGSYRLTLERPTSGMLELRHRGTADMKLSFAGWRVDGSFRVGTDPAVAAVALGLTVACGRCAVEAGIALPESPLEALTGQSVSDRRGPAADVRTGLPPVELSAGVSAKVPTGRIRFGVMVADMSCLELRISWSTTIDDVEAWRPGHGARDGLGGRGGFEAHSGDQ